MRILCYVKPFEHETSFSVERLERIFEREKEIIGFDGFSRRESKDGKYWEFWGKEDFNSLEVYSILTRGKYAIREIKVDRE